MAIDDRLEKALDFYSTELETDIPKKIVSTAIAQIPHFGTEINKILFGDAQRRVAERAKDVFDAVKERVEKVEESKIDKEFLKSDEFMTILILAVGQLQTTHNREKLRMLANAIANSGFVDFSSDSKKELYLRIFGSLAPEHVAMLGFMRAKPPLPQTTRGISRPIVAPSGADLVVLQNLAAQGLVDEYEERERPSISLHNMSSESDIRRAVEKLVTTPSKRCFRINQFGEDFLKYFESQESATEEPQSKS